MVTIEQQIEMLKSEALTRIQGAAGEGDTISVLSISKIVESIERLAENLKILKLDVDRVQRDFDAVGAVDKEGVVRGYQELAGFEKQKGAISARQMGEVQRSSLLRDLKLLGINLTRQTTSLFKTDRGESVGIAYSSETKPNRWWLGLTGEAVYDILIFICLGEDGKALHFVVPKKFVQEYEKKFSSDVNGNLKFNIVLRSGRYQLLVPGVGGVQISQFLKNYDAFRT
jgi:hypothetical protein